MPRCKWLVVRPTMLVTMTLVLTSSGCNDADAVPATKDGRTSRLAAPEDVDAQEFERDRQQVADSGGTVAVRMDYEGRAFSDADLAELKLAAHITEINLAYTQITDAGLQHLERVPNLERLDLSGTKITDAALEQLKKLPNLKYVNIHGTQVTQEGHAEIIKFFANRRE